MLELPEAVVIAQQINATLRGRRIARAIANQSPHKFAWYTGDPADYNGWLAGKTIGAAAGCAGNVEIEAGDRLLVIGAGLRYHPAGEKPPARHQLLLTFEDGAALSASIQMWGALLCIPAGEDGGFVDYRLAKLHPSPLDDRFDRAYFDSLVGADTDKLPAKAFLATEQRIPGLGNGVLQDILWQARIHPRRKMAALSAEDVARMYDAVKSVLGDMTHLGGRDTERDLFGRAGGYRTVLSKNTVGRPCPACGAEIKKEAFLGGSIYYCPGCQPV